jgi:hypothetical protein
MSVINNLISDLREKRLWPVAVALILALIAVPVLLSSGGNSNVPVAQVPPVPAAPASVPALPAVTVTPVPSNARLSGRQRDPFIQQVKVHSTTSSSGTSKSSAAAGGSSASSTGSSASPGGSSGSSSGSTGSGSTGTPTTPSTSTSTTPQTSTTPTPTTTTAPAPSGLTATQAYHVALSLTNPTGRAYAINNVERLTVLPSEQQPLLFELGVLKGGHRVLFAVAPGTVLRGPGACLPAARDCEILSLAPNQIEAFAMTEPNGRLAGALIAVTAIKADGFASSTAANKARLAESAVGRRLLKAAKLGALSQVRYQPSLGAVVDLRARAAAGY